MSLGKNNYIDFHCHSALKPFGKSFNYDKVGVNNPHRSRSNSIWKYNPPSLADKLINFLTGITKFSQANFTSLAKGGVRIVCVSLYPIEQEFFVNKINNEILRDIAANFATGVGRKRVDFIQTYTDYFKDLEMEYDYYKQLDNKIINLPEGRFKYKLVSNFAEILALEKIEANNENTVGTIAVILSIEGMHVLNDNIRKDPSEAKFLQNINKIKSWERPPLFVTMAHHIWNNLCGHAESLSGLVKRKVNQSEGLNLGFTDLGLKVLDSLLDKTNGKRIIIDVKHMSIASRKTYYELLQSNRNYKEIPIIVSHGAANGMDSFDNWEQTGSDVATKLEAKDINFFNEELILIAKSKGILGLQLDERRVVNNKTLKDTKNSVKRSKIMHYRSELLWFQIQHIIEVIDAEGLFAWDCIALGSDFDGIIDPLNSFWTAEELPFLSDFLERHAYNYMQGAEFNVSANAIEADEIVNRIFTLNGREFLRANFK